MSKSVASKSSIITRSFSWSVMALLGLWLMEPLTMAAASASIAKRFLLSFHACNTATANCTNPQNHQVYLAESDDGASWSIVGGWTPYQGSVPDVIRRAQTIYVYTPGQVRRFRIDTNTWEDPVSITLADPQFTGFVDPSLFVDESGRLVLFYFATNTASGDPAACPAGTTCISHFRSATEIAGSDGTAFVADDGDRVSVAISPTLTNLDTATDPDIFFDGTRYVLYISRGNSIQVYTSQTLRGAYTLSPNLPGGFLTQNIGGIGSGVFDTAANHYWTFVHAPSVGTRAKIRRAVHPTLGTALQASDLAEVVGAESIGLGSSSTVGVESPGIALNAAISSAVALSGVAFRTGQTIAYQATLTPGSTPTQVDIYLGALLPDGVTFLSLIQTVPGVISIALGSSPIPFLANVPLVPLVVPFSTTFTGLEPVGTYFTYAGLAVAGSNPLQPANQLSLGVQVFQFTP